ncbi:MAG: ATP cone domain-containing protein, partial [Planctomycetota bacterium]
MIGRITRVRKRDGRLVDFDETKIADAIHKASCAVGRDDRFLAEELAGVVTLFLEKRFTGTVPGIEEIQDMVEKVLIETGHAKMAKAYILYRERRARAREQVSVHGG